MNYLTNVKNVIKLSQQELQSTSKSSWHDQYKDSAWIYVGGLPFDLTEGDIICIFSQYGEVVNINLIRAKDTGKSKGFCFLCYEDQRSTILAVDNLNGIKILNRTIRVDHVQDYKVPKDKKANEETKNLYSEGCAPKPVPMQPVPETPNQQLRETLADQIDGHMKLPARLPIYTNVKSEKQSSDTESEKPAAKRKKDKKRRKSNSSESDDKIKVKQYNKEGKQSNSKSYSSKHKSHKSKHKNWGSPKRKARSPSEDKDATTKGYAREPSASIPKRWR